RALRRSGNPADPAAAEIRSGRPDRSRSGWQTRSGASRMGSARIAWRGDRGKVRNGDVISGLDAASNPALADPAVKVFHAGTKLDGNGNIVTAGGRVLTVCALGDNLQQARDRAYAAAERIRFDGAFHRRDIGHRALIRG